MMPEPGRFDPTILGDTLFLTKTPRFIIQSSDPEFDPFISGPRLVQNQTVPINVLDMEYRCRLTIDEVIEKFERAGVDIRCFEMPRR